MDSPLLINSFYFLKDNDEVDDEFQKELEDMMNDTEY